MGAHVEVHGRRYQQVDATGIVPRRAEEVDRHARDRVPDAGRVVDDDAEDDVDVDGKPNCGPEERTVRS